MSYLRFLAYRLLLAAVVLAGVLVLTFFVARVLPSDAAARYAGTRPTPEQVARIRVEMGFDQPLPTQFARYIGGVLQGDLGVSLTSRRAILADIARFLPATLELVFAAMLLAVVIGIPSGVVAAAMSGTRIDGICRSIAVLGVSIPNFWLALMLQLVFFGWLGWLPLGGRMDNVLSIVQPIEFITGFYLVDAALMGNWDSWWSALHHLLLPAIVLASYPLGLAMRMTRAAMLDTLSAPYIVAARALGFSERFVLFRVALKNSIVPTLNALALTFAYAITGAFLVEIIFSWNGIGKYLSDAVLNADFPVVMGVTLVVTLIYLLVNLMVDLAQAMIDPRMALE